MPTTTIRLLTRDDGPAYQQLRLHSLQESPESFLASYDKEQSLHENAFSDHLDWAYHPPHYGYFGFFLDDKLIGYVQVSKTYLDKQEHIVSLNNLYIAPEYRHHGYAKQLFQYVLDLLSASEHVERAYLSCTARNKPAHQFYQKMGFRRYGVKARAIKWQNQYDDEIEMVKVLK